MKKGATRKAGKGKSASKTAASTSAKPGKAAATKAAGAKNAAAKKSPAKGAAKKAAATKPAAKGTPAKASPKKAAPTKAVTTKAAGAKKSPAKGAAKKAAATKPAAKATPAKASPKKAAPTKAVTTKAAAKAAPKKAAPATATKSAAATNAAAKATPAKAAPKKPAPAKTRKPAAQQELAFGASENTPLDAHAGRAMIIQILGDAEAYFIDYSRLSPAQRAELVEHHLAAWDARKRAEGHFDWADSFVPVALIGESMPPDVRGRFDLSAPHEGVVLFHRETGALLHASSKDDDQLALMAPDIETISPAPSFVSDVVFPTSFAYAVNRTESEGFTRANIEMLMMTGGAQLVLV